LVGREQEQQTVLKSQTPITLVHGIAGTGKSRLLTSSLPNALYLKCLEGLEHVPYYPIVAYIRKHLDSLADLLALTSYKTDLARLIPEIEDTHQDDGAETPDAFA